MTFTPSEYNLAIREEWRTSNKNIGIKARAGSGKTSQLLWMAEDVEAGLFVSFSKSIVEELAGKLKERGSKMTARTGHSLGLAACKNAIKKYPASAVNNLKYFKIAQEWVDTYGKMYAPRERRDVVDALKALTDHSMLQMLDGTDLNEVYRVAQHYDVQTDQYMVEGVKWVIEQGSTDMALAKYGFSFTDMLYLPVMHNFKLEPIETLFFDECLPYHTPIHLADGTSLDIGDIVENKLSVNVLSYDSISKQQKICKVTGWSKTLNQKPLVKIKTKGKNTSNFVVCTIDHKIFVNGEWVEAGKVKAGMIVQVESSAKKTNKYKITSQGRNVLSVLMTEKNNSGKMDSDYCPVGFKKRGGNGTSITIPQATLLEALGDGWVSEYVIPTGKSPKFDKFPNHYKIDIANVERKIAIEIDGKSHFYRREQDARKDQFLKNNGWRIFRFSNTKALQKTSECIKEINFCSGDDCPIEVTVVSVEPINIKDFFVYDITVEECHNFYANGILVHNCQDVSRLTLEFMRRSSNGRVVAVGDECQPEGTKVKCVSNDAPKFSGRSQNVFEKNIEDLEIGDKIITASLRENSFNYSGEVLGKSSRFFDGNLVVVTTESGKTSQYTPNHHCLVSFKPFDGKYFVYLMQKDSRFRIGISKMCEAGSFYRMRQEECDKAWILMFCETRIEALMWESAISGKFGIPQLMFNENNFTTGIRISQAWDFIGDNIDNGKFCLQYFFRDYRYPIYSSDMEYSTLRRPIITHASNLMDGCLVLPYNNLAHFRKSNWEAIKIDYKYYQGKVYSLTVSHNHLYVADGITTHNCQNIFGFAGVSSNAFYDVMDTFNCVQMPLNLCYRCGKNIVKLAQTIVPDIESPEWMHDGDITSLKAYKLIKTVKSGDAILCRTNAPLISTCLELIANGIKASILGRDIGKTLASHVKRIMKLGTWSEFLDLIPVYVQREIDKILRKADYSQSQVDYMNDIGACLLAVYQPTMLNEDILIATIEALFVPDDEKIKGVTLSTVHKAKGKEWDRIFIINPDKLPLIWADQKPHEFQQEKNIQYVAYTRPKYELCFVE